MGIGEHMRYSDLIQFEPIESVIQFRRGPSTQEILARDRNPPPFRDASNSTAEWKCPRISI
mgnify:CR=1 FL=1